MRRICWWLPLVFLTTLGGCAGPSDHDDTSTGTHVGTLKVTVVDPPEGPAQYKSYLKLDSGDWLQLEVTGEANVAPSWLLDSGSEVEVAGVRDGERLFVSRLQPYPSADSGVRRIAQPIVTGPMRTLAVVLIQSTSISNDFDPSEMRTRIFGEGTSANSFFRENSFDYFHVEGVESTEGDVFGPYNVNLSGCNINAIANEADAAAESDGHDMSAYDHVMYYFPANVGDCPGGGQGAQPGRETWLYGIGINSAWDYASHELGHNFGLFHAASYTGCQAPGGACAHDEYGDPTDVMGGRNFQYSSYHKEKLSWLPPENVDVVTESKQVRIYPVETASTGIQSVRIPRSNGDQIHLEYRQPIGFDQRLESGLTDGVLVRVGPDPNPAQRGDYAHLFDMKPQTNNMTDAALAGSTFEDGNLQITTVQASSDWALVDIVLDGVEPPPIDDGGASGSGVGGTSTTGTGGSTTTGMGMTMTAASSNTSTTTGGSMGTAVTGAGGTSASITSVTGTTGSMTTGSTIGSGTTGALTGTTGAGGAVTASTATSGSNTSGVATLSGGDPPATPNSAAGDSGGCACSLPKTQEPPGRHSAWLALAWLGAAIRRRFA